jgi:hypothetical protein
VKVIAVLAALVFALASASAASAARVFVVDSPQELRETLERVQARAWPAVVVLRPGRYPQIVLRRARRVTLRGPGASTRSLRILDSSRIRVQRLAVRSGSGRSQVTVVRSSRVWLERVTVAGNARASSQLRFVRGGPITVRRSVFSQCGDGVACLTLGRAGGVTVRDTVFEDCEGCDFIRGRVGVGLKIRDNTFGNAVTGRCWRLYRDLARCNHQDIVQVQRGRKIVIERNRFGVQELGAAQIYLAAGPIDDVVVRNNVFQASAPLRPGWIDPVGIMLGNRSERYGPPTRVVIAHNTILSGAYHEGRGSDSSIVLSPLYADVPLELQPIIVNNLLASARSSDWLCGRTQTMASNVIADGTACSDDDDVGDPLVDPFWGRPDPSSPLVDAALPGWAVDDVDRAPRAGPPDIGAYEL